MRLANFADASRAAAGSYRTACPQCNRPKASCQNNLTSSLMKISLFVHGHRFDPIDLFCHGPLARHAFDLCAQVGKLFFDGLVTAIDVINAVHFGGALGHQTCQHQTCRGAQVGCH